MRWWPGVRSSARRVRKTSLACHGLGSRLTARVHCCGASACLQFSRDAFTRRNGIVPSLSSPQEAPTARRTGRGQAVANAAPIPPPAKRPAARGPPARGSTALAAEALTSLRQGASPAPASKPAPPGRKRRIASSDDDDDEDHQGGGDDEDEDRTTDEGMGANRGAAADGNGANRAGEVSAPLQGTGVPVSKARVRTKKSTSFPAQSQVLAALCSSCLPLPTLIAILRLDPRHPTQAYAMSLGINELRALHLEIHGSLYNSSNKERFVKRVTMVRAGS